MQKKNSFDKDTRIKIGKGAIIAAAGAAGIAFFDYVGTIHIEEPMLAALLAFLLPFSINLIKEWQKGKK